jgi:hypothetical protein
MTGGYFSENLKIDFREYNREGKKALWQGARIKYGRWRICELVKYRIFEKSKDSKYCF